jgi:TRAP-type mannitol/chloroaromatic compound transport system substrate-binding protein
MVERDSALNRRSFLTRASIAALAVGGPGAMVSEGAAATDETKTFRWRLQHIEPSTSANYKIYEQWVKDVDTASSGRLKIRLFPAGSLAPNEEAFDAVGKGQFEMAVSSPGYHRAKMPEIEAVNPPHAYRNLTDLLMIYYKAGLRDFYRESYSGHNIFLLDMAACRGVVLLSTKPVNSVQDLAKLKIRTHTTYAQFVEQLGAKTLFIPGGEVYTGLASGTADAATWGDETTIRDLKWYEVAKYLVYPMLLEAMFSYDTLVNKKAWDSLPADLQVIVQKASSEHIVVGNYLKDMNLKDQSIAEMAKAGVKASQIRQEDYPRLIQAAEAVWASTAAKSPRAKQAMKIITDYFRAQGYTKFKID